MANKSVIRKTSFGNNSGRWQRSDEPSATVVATFSELIAAVFRELFARRRGGARFTADERRAIELEHDAHRAANEAIRKKYGGALANLKELQEREERAGVSFSAFIDAPTRAAILDFLDNPSAPTPLDTIHMTWFCGRDAEGKPTHSMTHPVNQARYTILSRESSAIYPAERRTWSVAQWREHEQRGQQEILAAIRTAHQRRRTKDLDGAGL